MTREELEQVINNIRESINETDAALISENLLSIVSSYSSLLETNQSLSNNIESLNNERDELLIVNGKLFQQVGFTKETVPSKEIDEDNNEESITLEDVIDENGGLIYG